LSTGLARGRTSRAPQRAHADADGCTAPQLGQVVSWVIAGRLRLPMEVLFVIDRGSTTEPPNVAFDPTARIFAKPEG